SFLTGIVLLGESQNRKSSLANTIFGEAIFKLKEFNDAKSFTTEAKTKFVNGRNFTLIDTPGLFDSGRPQKTVKSELMRCMIESAPGPHIFLIILKVEKYTEQEKDVIAKIRRYFSDDALKYAAVIFTHGDQLPEGMNIQQYAAQSDGLWELVQKCGGRCHVFDNKYWRNTEEEEYRSNKFQLAELFKTIDKILIKNKGGHFIKKHIEIEEEKIRQSTNQSPNDTRDRAKSTVPNGLMILIVGSATGAMVGAFRGNSTPQDALYGALKGSQLGYIAAAEAKTVVDAILKAAQAALLGECKK
uniref:AIG1-type G domain-containing protein n=1 Tax=Cyprinodon variegatus TaxID=28743 RepID=A0A3Q2CH60_CYPVA